ncbi:MAG TPA: hypothetical protein VF910_04150, partial [Candidatus Bathyarchaeia archaeon]
SETSLRAWVKEPDREVVEDRGISEVSNLRTEKTVLCIGMKRVRGNGGFSGCALCNLGKNGV